MHPFIPSRRGAALAALWWLAGCASTGPDPTADAGDAARRDASDAPEPEPDVADNEPDVPFEIDDAADDDASGPAGDAGATDAGVTPDAAPRDAAPPPPPYAPGCTATLPTCPTGANTRLTEGAGLRAATHCAFRLADRNGWAASEARITRLRATLPVVTVNAVLADGNRDAVEVTSLSRVASFRQGFRWNDGDANVAYWYPQGITGTGDAFASGTVGGRRAVLVSWYDNGMDGPTRGVRISFADVTNARAVTYRHALLVALRDDGARVEFDPVPVHAGGIVWYGRYLYVPDTGRGFRVFDMERIMRVAATGDTIGYDAAARAYSAAGYRYIIPQVSEYVLAGSCPLRFSFAALDRSTTPHSIVSGEYISPGVDGRLARWHLDPTTGRLALPTGAREAFFGQQSRVQGGLSWRGTFYLSCSSQNGTSYGALYRARVGAASREFAQPAGVEDLYHDPTTGLLWGLTEHPPNRYVYAAPLASY